MLYYTSTHADVAESFLLGLSCLVGGDQFYILVSKTDASPKTQSYIAITTVLSTLFLALVLYDKYNRSLFDITHVLYLVLLVIWGLILYQNVKNPFVTTYYNSILWMVMTFLVIISCVHYSHQKELLPSFLSGMLCARLLPSLLWIFVHQKKADRNSNLSSLSARLAFFRLAFCISAMILKFTSGHLDFSLIKFDTVNKYDWYVIRTYAFNNIWDLFNKLFIRSFNYNKLSVIRAATFLLFFSPLILHLALPPVVYKFSYMYSCHLYSRIDIIRTVSHLLGVALGTKYPVSKTTNSYYFPTIYFGYGVYVFGLGIVNNYFKIRSKILLYTILILTGFVFGYIWSYSLIIIKNLFFVRTCVHEEGGSSPCCGDKIESQCYCRLDPISKDMKSCNSDKKMFDCSNLCSNSKGLRYCMDGKCAILLIKDDGSGCSQDCSTCCQSSCANGTCCLKLIGKYKIDAVTVSSCEDCQLTIRLEGNCVDPGKCPKCCDNGQQGCTCQNGKCCCLCLKCCTSQCDSECKCCIHICNGNSCNQCCQGSTGDGVRVFICFKNNNKCCIREIRPNSSKQFRDDLKIQNEFDIKGVSFFDCCHVDITVDIQCSMKNNFFRTTPINYPKKNIKLYSLTLMRSGTECCKPENSKCCCKNTDFVTVCVKYHELEKNCEIKCTCQGSTPGCCCSSQTACQCCSCKDGKCCCCLTCELAVNTLTSFYNMIEPVRVKLVVFLWLLFMIFLIFIIWAVSKVKNKKLKSYQFYPISSFQTVNKELDDNGMNSIHSVLDRLRTAHQGIFLELFGEKDKKTDLAHMLQLCKCAFDPCSLNTLRHYVLSKSSMLIASPHYINRRLNLELVKWSYCVGFVYTYILLMFFRIQEYFLRWEEVWIIEFQNYRGIMTSKFNNLTQKSKSSMSLVCEKDVKHKTTLYTDTSKKGGWGCSHDELDIYTNLNEREREMNKTPPHRLDLRLMFYLERWKHRVETIKFWTENETNIYDWTGLMNEYPRIRSWFFNFFPHIERTSHEMNIPLEKINEGTEILESEVLDLMS